MILTARQLDDLHRTSGGNGRLTLPYRARLSPLAADWIRAKKISIGYSDVELSAGGKAAAPVAAAPVPTSWGIPVAVAEAAPAGSTPSILCWCDGPCGPAKAAVAAQAKESSLTPLAIPSDPKQIVTVVRAIAAEVKAGRASGAVLLVNSASAATVLANRCPVLRAVGGTCLEAVDQGLKTVAANVLIIEYPHKTLQQIRNMLARFARGPHEPSEDVKRQLQELASCG